MAALYPNVILNANWNKNLDTLKPKVIITNNENESVWDKYVSLHPSATLYHLYGWKRVIEKSYGHKTYYLMALKNDSSGLYYDNVSGILPLVHLNHFIFGNHIISLPFFDACGVIADDDASAFALIGKAIEIAEKQKSDTLEIRHATSGPMTSNSIVAYLKGMASLKTSYDCIKYLCKTHKVRMILDLPNRSNMLMGSFKSKLRSQIMKPMKIGLWTRIGGKELIDDFYKVFVVNMRDLGSPVHSKEFIRNVLEHHRKEARVVAVYKGKEPVACSLVIGYKKTLMNPWSSALRKYSSLSPNMLLYWTMLAYACDNGYRNFDFGRFTPNEGTYNFKAQWGAKPVPLFWHYFSLNKSISEETTSKKMHFDAAIHFWQKLPVPITQLWGPMIRKYIGL